MFASRLNIPESEARAMSPRLLAHLGDAVFHLYEREREIRNLQTASQVHKSATQRASAGGQANLLELISSRLTDEEADIVRRARNLKLSQRRADQAAYRLATAFEALLGYLYLTNMARLEEVLDWTLPQSPETGAGEAEPNVKDSL
jgi:ribonuclease-3 family protein